MIRNSSKKQIKSCIDSTAKKSSIKTIVDIDNSSDSDIDDNFSHSNCSNDCSNCDSVVDITLNQSNNICDVANNFFTYNDIKFIYIMDIEEKRFYFNAIDILQFLEYADPIKSIYDDIKERYKIEFKHIEKYHYNRNRLSENTMFITESGLISLCMQSKNNKARNFFEFIVEQIIPSSLRATRSTNILYNTSQMKVYFNMMNLYKLLCRNVMYMGVIGFNIFNNGYLIKFGKSNRVVDLIYDEHQKTFGKQFEPIYIKETDNNDVIEVLFRDFLQSHNLLKEFVFDGKIQQDIFVTTSTFSIEKVVDVMDNLIMTNISLQTERDNILSIEREKQLKQSNLVTKLKKIQLEIKKLELKELKLEREINCLKYNIQ